MFARARYIHNNMIHIGNIIYTYLCIYIMYYHMHINAEDGPLQNTVVLQEHTQFRRITSF